MSLNQSYDYTIRIMEEGNDLFLVHDVWWTRSPNVNRITSSQSKMFQLELAEFEEIKDPTIMKCQEDVKVKMTKVNGTTIVRAFAIL